MNNQQVMRTVMIFVIVFFTAKAALASETAEPGFKPAAESVNSFAFDMYAGLSKEDGNIFFSPYSISSAMAMLFAGTSGEAEREAREVMRYQEDIHPSMSELRNELEAGAEGELSVANAIWPDIEFELLPSYLSIIGDYYGGEVTQFDFRLKWRDAEDAINMWTAERTRGMIEDLFQRDDLMPNGPDVTSLVLTNAVYFFSKWKEPFEKEDTSSGAFFGETEQETEFMTQTNTFPYFETEDFQLLEMPYEDGRRSFVALLPREQGGIKSLEASLAAGDFAGWRERAPRERVRVYIPKFELEWEMELAPVFKSMGLQSIFERSRDNFKNMTNIQDELCVSRIIHKTKITLDEEKTEAAAVTGIAITRTTAAFPPREPYEFRADHPFIFFIADNQTGAILFMGRFSEPE